MSLPAALSFVCTSCFALRAFVRAEASEPEKSLMYTNEELTQYTSMAQKIQRVATRKIKICKFGKFEASSQFLLELLLYCRSTGIDLTAVHLVTISEVVI